jgi:hypothetical protein
MLPQRATRFSDRTTLVCRSWSTSWPRYAASALLKICNQLHLKLNKFAQIIVLLVSIASIVFLASCSFGYKNFDQTNGLFTEPDEFVIQVDDYGSFWDPNVPVRALETISKESQRINTIVVLFIHGWHHNAAVDDDNAKDFASSLAQVRATLDDNIGGRPGMYRLSRELLTGNGDVKVIGIYVGWRGKSLPMPLDYITFWGRKAAAERVGEGDLREFLLRLNYIYRDRNGPRTDSPSKPFMGMVSFGHSFGGQVLFKAIAGALEQELIEVISTSSANQKVPLAKQLAGFGDITVLVNPALEAFQYERIHRLGKQIEYDRQQTPLLLVLSSENDLARQFFFPAGRMVDALFRTPFRENQRAQWTEALGEYEAQRTHTVEILPKDATTSTKFDHNIYKDNPCGLVNYDLTNVPVIGGVQLKPTASRPHRFSPFLVTYASGKVIVHHSGIFKQELRNFLNDYIAITEGKRILLANPKMASCPDPKQ